MGGRHVVCLSSVTFRFSDHRSEVEDVSARGPGFGVDRRRRAVPPREPHQAEIGGEHTRALTGSSE